MPFDTDPDQSAGRHRPATKLPVYSQQRLPLLQYHLPSESAIQVPNQSASRYRVLLLNNLRP